MKIQYWLERFQDRLDVVEAELRACLPRVEDPALSPFYGMVAYHMGWMDASFCPTHERTGKRLRPLLCLLACEIAAGTWQPALPAAVALELLHNFTLIHDDIEDNSPLRRGRPTVWSLWGVPQAINAGDGLFVLARMALLRLSLRGLADGIVLQAIEILDRTILRICEGQHLDLFFEGRLDVDEPAYTGMIARKTAALLEASVHLGALVGGLDAAGVESLRSFGYALGLAFQVQDDVLGVWGEPARTGKPASADIYQRKLGFPLVHALEHATADDRGLIEQVVGGMGSVLEVEVQSVLAVLDRTGSRAYAERQAAEYHERALGALRELSPSPARSSLEEITFSLLGRRT